MANNFEKGTSCFIGVIPLPCKGALAARVKLDSFMTNRDKLSSVKSFWSTLAHIGREKTFISFSQKSLIS